MKKVGKKSSCLFGCKGYYTLQADEVVIFASREFPMNFFSPLYLKGLVYLVPQDKKCLPIFSQAAGHSVFIISHREFGQETPIFLFNVRSKSF